MILVAICSVVLCAVVWRYFTKAEDPLDKLPGPPRKPIIDNSLDLMNIKPEDLFLLLSKYTKLYGERFIMKGFGFLSVQITNPEDIEIVLSHSKNIKKSLPYTFLQPWLGTGLLLSTGSKWHKRRKILTPTFHFNILKSFFIVMEEKSRNLVTLLKEKKGKEVDVLPVISDFTLYAICETAMGTQLDLDQSAAAVQYKNAIMNIGYMLLSRISKIWLHYDFIFKRTKHGKHFEKSLEIVDTFAGKVIAERRKQHAQTNGFKTITEDGSKRRMAMLDLLLEAEQKGEIDLEGIREEVNTFMFEGHDTTAMGLTFGLLLLADHEDIQERVYEECKDLFERCKGKPSMSDFSEMKYLEAVIKETLRVYPSVPFIAREIDEDFMMRDLPVRKGVEVSMNIYCLHHREDIYPEPEKFKPERFLNGETRHPYAFIPFSAGPRNCIGQRFAMLEMKSVLYDIMLNFKLEPKIKGWRPAISAPIVLRPLDPIYVKFIPRV